ncbi:MAG TPA: serine/threonine-protein kinase [Vicinamibacteria bacterium]
MLLQELGQPATIGRYDIRREIGRGMMGVVYEALDTVLGRTIALKAIQLAFPIAPHEQEEFERRFFAEAQIAARLSHPNIVVVHDVGRDPESGTLFIALEHLQGQPLSALVSAACPMPWREALRIVQRVAEALHHAHAQGVVHRDVKPANIVLLASGEPKILDFGIARLAQEQGHLTPGRHFFGTPLYMSPEQALGRPIDGRSDLFALGAVLYFLLVGRAAFAAENIPTILVRVVRQYPPPPSFLMPDVPAVVDDIVARATAKEPAHRYPDGHSMAEDIEDVLAGRVARHRAGWRAPARVEAASGTVADTDDPLEFLQSELGLRDAIESSMARALVPTVELPRPIAPAIVPLASADEATSDLAPLAVRPRLTMLAATLVLVATCATGFSGRRIDSASPTPATGVAADRAALIIRAASPAIPAPASPRNDARLAVTVEHSLKRGRLRLWVDGTLRLQQSLSDRIATRVASRPRRDRTRGVIELEPGAHEVKVEVAWDDEVRTERAKATFRPGDRRVLAARLGGFFRKTLSLRWQ